MAVVVAQLVERVASNTRCTRFVSSHRKIYIKIFFCQLFWIDENKEKEDLNGLFLKKEMVVVKWAVCSPSTPSMQVQILLKPTVFL